MDTLADIRKKYETVIFLVTGIYATDFNDLFKCYEDPNRIHEFPKKYKLHLEHNNAEPVKIMRRIATLRNGHESRNGKNWNCVNSGLRLFLDARSRRDDKFKGDIDFILPPSGEPNLSFGR